MTEKVHSDLAFCEIIRSRTWTKAEIGAIIDVSENTIVKHSEMELSCSGAKRYVLSDHFIATMEALNGCGWFPCAESSSGAFHLAGMWFHAVSTEPVDDCVTHEGSRWMESLDAAALTGVSRTTLSKLAKRGEIHRRGIGARNRPYTYLVHPSMHADSEPDAVDGWWCELPEASEALGLAPSDITQMVRDGHIHCRRRNGKLPLYFVDASKATVPREQSLLPDVSAIETNKAEASPCPSGRAVLDSSTAVVLGEIRDLLIENRDATRALLARWS